MINADYKDFFVAIASASGALTGLLFVALSVTGGREASPIPPVIQQVRASAALLAFVNALAVSLFALVPGTHLGYPAVIFGVVGTVFTAAAIRSIAVSEATFRQAMGQMGLVLLLLAIFGSEIVAGIILLVGSRTSGAEEVVGYALVTSLLVGVARAWELVGERGTGLIASLAELTGHRHFQGVSRGGTGGDGGTGADGGTGGSGSGAPDQTPGGNGQSSTTN